MNTQLNEMSIQLLPAVTYPEKAFVENRSVRLFSLSGNTSGYAGPTDSELKKYGIGFDSDDLDGLN